MWQQLFQQVQSLQKKIKKKKKKEEEKDVAWAIRASLGDFDGLVAECSDAKTPDQSKEDQDLQTALAQSLFDARQSQDDENISTAITASLFPKRENMSTAIAASLFPKRKALSHAREDEDLPVVTRIIAQGKVHSEDDGDLLAAIRASLFPNRQSWPHAMQTEQAQNKMERDAAGEKKMDEIKAIEEAFEEEPPFAPVGSGSPIVPRQPRVVKPLMISKYGLGVEIRGPLATPIAVVVGTTEREKAELKGATFHSPLHSPLNSEDDDSEDDDSEDDGDLLAAIRASLLPDRQSW